MNFVIYFAIVDRFVSICNDSEPPVILNRGKESSVQFISLLNRMRETVNVQKWRG